MPNDFKISFSIDLNPYMAGLKTMLSMTQSAGQQIQPLLNLQVKAPEFGVFEKQLVDLENELAGMAAAQAEAAASVEKTGLEEKKTAGQTDGLTDAEKRNKVATDMMSESFQRSFFAINTLQQVSGILKSTLGGLVGESNAQERAEMAYVHALENRNLLTESSISDARSFASEIQTLTGIQDEQTIMTMAQLSAMGLQGEQLKEAAKLAADLSVVMDTDMRTAARLMADAFNGNTGMLGRYIKGLDEADIKQRGTVSILEQLRTAVGGQAEAFGRTAPGQMAVYERSVDEVKESLGSFLTQALLPILAPLKGILDLFLEFPKPVQALVGGAVLLTTTLVALEAIGVRAAMKSMYEAASTVIPRFVASLSVVDTAAFAAAEAMTTLQLSMFGLLGIAAIAVAFVGMDAYLKHNEEQMLRNAEAAKKAKKELDEYVGSLKAFSKEDLSGAMQGLKKEIFETGVQSLALQEQIDALGTVSANPKSDSYDKTLLDRRDKLAAEKRALDEANDARKKQLALMQDEQAAREKEAADAAKLLGSKNLLIKAEAELEAAKEKLKNPTLNEEEIKAINREIQVKENAVKRLQELGRTDEEAQKKSIETRRRLQEELAKFTEDLQTKQLVRQVELDEKVELLAIDAAIKKNGDSEEYELAKIAITEKYAIKRIEIEARAAVQSLEIEKQRLEALNTAEARYQIEIITKRQELIKSNATEEVKSVRQESDIKVQGINLEVPGAGSIAEQEKVVAKAAERVRNAETEAARKAAQEQLRIEQDKLEKMTKSSRELSEEQKRHQEEFRRDWLESHRVAAAAIEGVSAGVETMWSQFVIGTRQAKDGWDAVWLSMRNHALQVLGAVLQKEIENALFSVAAQTQAEATKTTVTVSGAAARSTALSAETGLSLKSAAADIVGAATAAIRWQVATFGPFAIATIPATLAAIYQLFSAVKRSLGFREGGRVKKGESGFFEGEGDEIIAPEKDFKTIAREELIPWLLIEAEQFNRKRSIESVTTSVSRLELPSLGTGLRPEDLAVLQEMRDEFRDMKKVLKGKNFSPVFTGLLDGQKLIEKNLNKAQRDLAAIKK